MTSPASWPGLSAVHDCRTRVMGGGWPVSRPSSRHASSAWQAIGRGTGVLKGLAALYRKKHSFGPNFTTEFTQGAIGASFGSVVALTVSCGRAHYDYTSNFRSCTHPDIETMQSSESQSLPLNV